MTRSLILVLLTVLPLSLLAQLGGKSTYQFLTLPTSARSASLGGYAISQRDGDINLVADNPALLDSRMANHAALSYINYISDINFGYATYAREVGNTGVWSGGLQFINYGEFTEADFTGQQIGTFSAGEYALNTTYSRALDSLFQVGGSFKVIYSSFYGLQSMGLAVDMGATYQSKNKRFTAAIVAKNFGAQVITYRKGNREPLPAEMQIGISKRVNHAPFRISLLYRHLQQWDLDYESPQDLLEQENSQTSTGIESEENFFTFDKFMRHMVMGVEFLPSKNFNIRLAYNYQRRQELKLNQRTGITGLSFGLGLRVNKFHISYGLASYHLAGISNHITFSTNLSDWSSKSSG